MGFSPSRASTTTRNTALPELVQTGSAVPIKQLIIGTNNTELDLQIPLTQSNQLVASSNSNSSAITKVKPTQICFTGWPILGLSTLGGLGAILFLWKWFGQFKYKQQSQISELKALSPANDDPVSPLLSEVEKTPEQEESTASVTSSETATVSFPAQVLLPETTSRLAKINIVDELIQDLHSSDPAKRRKAIWDLGQEGDSRAIQPLIDSMSEADSQQRSLTLAALAEISTRTLKPMNRALALSMQDDSPQVRQNAIRDLTRVYDMMHQMSQMLSHALDDPDTDVQATARYALTQINRIRSLPEQQSLREDGQ